MELLYVIYTHNRPAILKECLRTLFENTEVRPDECVIIDDNSEFGTKGGLFRFAAESSKYFPINFIGFNSPQGYGVTAEAGLRYIQWRNPNFTFVVESDYVFRKGYMEEALAVMKACPSSLALSAYNNPDFSDLSKTEEMFPRIMKEDFGSDLARREFLHKPRFIDTELGKIQIQFTTNSCGSFLLNWKNIRELIIKYPEIQETVFDRSCNKQPGGNRRFFGDGPFSHGLSHYWYIDKIFHNNANFETEGAWVDICDWSIGQHCNGAGINGGIVPEGATFVGSKTWSNEYLNKNPRQ